MADALVIGGLSKGVGGLRAVQDVSFSVKENETVGLIGPNGAGKTTSFHLITGFHRPDSGSVMAYGREIVGLKPHDICAHGLARTFQVAKPFGAMTVLANVMTGAFLRDKNAAAAREKAREAIEFVGLSAREQTAAKDLTTIDQRRLEMARALATQPRRWSGGGRWSETRPSAPPPSSLPTPSCVPSGGGPAISSCSITGRRSP